MNQMKSLPLPQTRLCNNSLGNFFTWKIANLLYQGDIHVRMFCREMIIFCVKGTGFQAKLNSVVSISPAVKLIRARLPSQQELCLNSALVINKPLEMTFLWLTDRSLDG